MTLFNALTVCHSSCATLHLIIRTIDIFQLPSPTIEAAHLPAHLSAPCWPKCKRIVSESFLLLLRIPQSHRKFDGWFKSQEETGRPSVMDVTRRAAGSSMSISISPIYGHHFFFVSILRAVWCVRTDQYRLGNMLIVALEYLHAAIPFRRIWYSISQ